MPNGSDDARENNDRASATGRAANDQKGQIARLDEKVDARNKARRARLSLT